MSRARAKLERLHALEKERYVDLVAFAEIHGAIGEMDKVLDCYERAFADRTSNMAHAAIMPGLCPELVGNARYQAIIDRMKFPQGGR